MLSCPSENNDLVIEERMKDVMFKVAIAGVSAALGLTAVALDAAQAATFDLTGAKSIKSAFDLRSDGIDLTVTGFSTNPLPTGVKRTPSGMGVISVLDNSSKIDGKGAKDALNLMFSHTVELVSATFGAVDNRDEFTLFVDDLLVLFDEDIPSSKTYTFLPDLLGEKFSFAALEQNDNFYLKTVEVAKVDVPESALMLGLGAVAVGIVAQKKSQKEVAEGT